MHTSIDFKLSVNLVILEAAQKHERICGEKIKAFRLSDWMYKELSNESDFRSIVAGKSGYYLGYKVRNCQYQLPTMLTSQGIEYLIFEEGE